MILNNRLNFAVFQNLKEAEIGKRIFGLCKIYFVLLTLGVVALLFKLGKIVSGDFDGIGEIILHFRKI